MKRATRKLVKRLRNAPRDPSKLDAFLTDLDIFCYDADDFGHGKTLLHFLCGPDFADPVDIVKWVIDTCREYYLDDQVNAKDSHGWTPLHHACSNLGSAIWTKPRCSDLLIRSRADITVKAGPANVMPIHIAVACQDERIMRRLCEAGTPVPRFNEQPDHIFHTPDHILEYAMICSNARQKATLLLCFARFRECKIMAVNRNIMVMIAHYVWNQRE